MSAAGSSVVDMVFWPLTIDAADPAVLARFWAQALGYQPVPLAEPETTWHGHYRARLGGGGGLRRPALRPGRAATADLASAGAGGVMQDQEGKECCVG